MIHVDPFENECMWNDIDVDYRSTLLVIPDWVNADLLYIHDIWHHNGIISFDEILRKVCRSTSRLFEYNKIRSPVSARVGLGAAPIPPHQI